MIEISLAIIATYCLSIGAYIILEKSGISIKIEKKKESPNNTNIRSQNTPEIMGKADYSPRHRVTQGDIGRQDIKPEEKATTFAKHEEQLPTKIDKPSESTAERRSARVPNDELDETFNNVEFKQEFKASSEDGILSQEELQNEEEELAEMGYNLNQQASGVELTELQDAVKIVKKSNTSKREKSQIGELFYRISGTEVADQLMNDKIFKQRIREAMLFHLKQLSSKSKTATLAPVDFDINQYI